MAVVVHSYVAGAAVVVYVLFVAFVSSAPFVVLLVALLVVVTLPAPRGGSKLFMRGNGVVAQGFAGWLRKVLYYYNLAFFFSVNYQRRKITHFFLFLFAFFATTFITTFPPLLMVESRRAYYKALRTSFFLHHDGDGPLDPDYAPDEHDLSLEAHFYYALVQYETDCRSLMKTIAGVPSRGERRCVA